MLTFQEGFKDTAKDVFLNDVLQVENKQVATSAVYLQIQRMLRMIQV